MSLWGHKIGLPIVNKNNKYNLIVLQKKLYALEVKTNYTIQVNYMLA